MAKFLCYFLGAVVYLGACTGFIAPTYPDRSYSRFLAAKEDSASAVNGDAKNTESVTSKTPDEGNKMGLNLVWCDEELCKDVVRERVVGSTSRVRLTGPATGQVAYYWSEDDNSSVTARPNVFLLVRSGSDDLMKSAAEAVEALCHANVNVLLDPTAAARIKYTHGVDDKLIHLYEAESNPGFGTNLRHDSNSDDTNERDGLVPDIICTLGGDGLVMYAGMMFQGAVPPILCVSGGSLGFLTPFSVDEMVNAILISLGQASGPEQSIPEQDIDVFPPNMPAYPYTSPLSKSSAEETINQRIRAFGWGDRICLSIRMRLECSIYGQDGHVRTRYNVMNEVVVDRGISPYLAALECFCDDVHLTTVQADGVIFATPTGSTAYSLSAGSSVVHPAVPCILVTPICPHVLSFRPMVFPDHVVLRCCVPEDARAEASVAFDGRHRQELRRGEAIEVKMSPHPVPTINRVDHSADWLGSLKRNFNFNARPRQRPL